MFGLVSIRIGILLGGQLTSSGWWSIGCPSCDVRAAVRGGRGDAGGILWKWEG